LGSQKGIETALCQRITGTDWKKVLANGWNRKKITKKAHAGRGQETTWEMSVNKMNAEGVHLYGMRDGDAGFTLLASEPHSPYVDNRPLLTAGKPETRQ
jgi:hypothetical protein